MKPASLTCVKPDFAVCPTTGGVVSGLVLKYSDVCTRKATKNMLDKTEIKEADTETLYAMLEAIGEELLHRCGVLDRRLNTLKERFSILMDKIGVQK